MDKSSFYVVRQIPACEDEKKESDYHLNMNLYLDEYVKAFYYAQNKGLFWEFFIN